MLSKPLLPNRSVQDPASVKEKDAVSGKGTVRLSCRLKIRFLIMFSDCFSIVVVYYLNLFSMWCLLLCKHNKNKFKIKQESWMRCFFGICGLEIKNPRRFLTQRNGRDHIKGRTKYERTINCRATVKISNNKMWEKISIVFQYLIAKDL